MTLGSLLWSSCLCISAQWRLWLQGAVKGCLQGAAIVVVHEPPSLPPTLPPSHPPSLTFSLSLSLSLSLAVLSLSLSLSFFLSAFSTVKDSSRLTSDGHCNRILHIHRMNWKHTHSQSGAFPKRFACCGGLLLFLQKEQIHPHLLPVALRIGLAQGTGGRKSIEGLVSSPGWSKKN